MTAEQRKEDLQPAQRLCLGSSRGRSRTAGGSIFRMGWLCFLVKQRFAQIDSAFGLGVYGFEFRAFRILGSVCVGGLWFSGFNIKGLGLWFQDVPGVGHFNFGKRLLLYGKQRLASIGHTSAQGAGGGWFVHCVSLCVSPVVLSWGQQVDAVVVRFIILAVAATVLVP